jgi:hypothetical protein
VARPGEVLTTLLLFAVVSWKSSWTISFFFVFFILLLAAALGLWPVVGNYVEVRG